MLAPPLERMEDLASIERFGIAIIPGAAGSMKSGLTDNLASQFLTRLAMKINSAQQEETGTKLNPQ